MGQCFIMRRWRIAASQPIVTQYLYGIPSANANIGLRSGDDVTLYYGTVLPKLPEWDTETYPYAFMEILTSGYIRFYVITSKVAKNTDGTLLIYATEDCRYKFYTQRNDNTWSESAELLLRAGDPMFHTTDGHEPIPIWANWTMMGSGNVPYLAASDAIQVSELVDAIDGMPIYMPVVPDVPEATMFIYGRPLDTKPTTNWRKVGLRSGGVVTFYDGAVLPATPERDEETYPIVTIDLSSMNNIGIDMFADYTPTETKMGDGSYSKSMEYAEYLHASFNGNKWVDPSFSWSELTQKTNGFNYQTEIFWTNTDIVDVNGNIVIGKCGDPIPVSGIVGYSYNGTVLPELPDTEFQNALIFQTSGLINAYHLWVGAEITNNGGDISISGGHQKYRCTKPDLSEWVLSGSGMDIAVTSYSNVEWANFDVLDENGAVALTKSNPIPVYE